MKMLLGGIFCLIWGLLIYLLLSSGLGFNYKEIVGEAEARAIWDTRIEEYAVKPAVFDIIIQNNVAYGYRLPAIDVICEGNYPATKLQLMIIYFALDLDEGVVSEFEGFKQFSSFLKEYQIVPPSIYADLKNGETIKHYEELYSNMPLYKDCKIDSGS
ncbi:MAG: hypothetical protein ACFHVJ_01420 [Aestuariibacter sp.]